MKQVNGRLMNIARIFIFEICWANIVGILWHVQLLAKSVKTNLERNDGYFKLGRNMREILFCQFPQQESNL